MVLNPILLKLLSKIRIRLTIISRSHIQTHNLEHLGFVVNCFYKGGFRSFKQSTQT